MKRREILKGGGMVAAAVAGPFFHIRAARADKGELVVVSWGGDYDDAMREFVFPVFEKATGYTVKLDAPPELAKAKAMVQSGNVSWDVVMTDTPGVLAADWMLGVFAGKTMSSERWFVEASGRVVRTPLTR